MKRAVPLIFLLFGCGFSLTGKWEKRAEKDPVGVLTEIADSLESQAFRRKMQFTPLGPKVSNLFSDILLSLKYDKLSLDDLLKVAQANKSYIRYLYTYGLFDERWKDAAYSYREILKTVRRKIEGIENLDSLAEIARSLKPPITAKVYDVEYEKIVDLYRKKSISEGEVRWGMSEEDVYKVWGKPDSVDTVLSVRGSSFGKMLNYNDRKVLLIDGRVEDVFGR